MNAPAERLAALTVTVITKDAAATLERSLRSVAFAGRVIVLDCGSVDDTVALARRLGAEVHVTGDWPGFGRQKNRALALADTPWVLSLDADEWVSAPLAKRMRAIVGSGAAAGAADGYWIARRNWVGDRHIKGCNWWPDRQLRLFRREHGCFTDSRVHERVELSGVAARLPHSAPLEHEPARDLGAWAARNVTYACTRAAELAEAGHRVGLLKLWLGGPWRFFRDYVLTGGFRDGIAGLVIAATNAYATLLRNALTRRHLRGG